VASPPLSPAVHRRIVAFYGAPQAQELGQLQERPGLALVLNAGGSGDQAIKRAKYGAFTRSPRDFFHKGFKLFYREDTDLMSRARCCACGRRPTS
jgi:hypothetical protein